MPTMLTSFPANEEMMKVLKPMTDLLLQCLPVFEKYNLKLSSLFIAAEEICGGFDKCAPTGTLITTVNAAFYYEPVAGRQLRRYPEYITGQAIETIRIPSRVTRTATKLGVSTISSRKPFRARSNPNRRKPAQTNSWPAPFPTSRQRGRPFSPLCIGTSP